MNMYCVKKKKKKKTKGKYENEVDFYTREGKGERRPSNTIKAGGQIGC